MQFDLLSPLPKTSPDGCRSIVGMPSAPSSRPLWDAIPPSFRHANAGDGGATRVWLMDQKDAALGGRLMRNFSAWPSAAAVCSLSSVLETGPIPRKYFLSAKACAGILRRAEKRGKALPPMLKAALESVAATLVEAPKMMTTPLQPEFVCRACGEENAATWWPTCEWCGTEQESVSGGGRTSGPIEQAACLTSHGQRLDFEVETFVAHALRGEGFDASEDGTGRGTPLVPVQMPPDIAGTLKACAGKSGLPNGAEEADRLVPVAFRTSPNCGAWETGDRTDALTTATDPAAHVLCFSSKDHGADASVGVAPTMRAMGHADSHANAGGQLDVAYDLRGREGGAQFEGPHDTANIRAASGGSSRSYVADRWVVRRLTPDECEALQGFPRGYTAGQADGPRYKQLGNSWAVNVARWIGERIDAALRRQREEAA